MNLEFSEYVQEYLDKVRPMWNESSAGLSIPQTIEHISCLSQIEEVYINMAPTETDKAFLQNLHNVTLGVIEDLHDACCGS
mgnify:CR=1 FL=1